MEITKCLNVLAVIILSLIIEIDMRVSARGTNIMFDMHQIYSTLILNYIPDNNLVRFLEFINKYNKTYENHYEFNYAFFNFNENVENINYKNYEIETNILNNMSNFSLIYETIKPYHIQYSVNKRCNWRY